MPILTPTKEFTIVPPGRGGALRQNQFKKSGCSMCKCQRSFDPCETELRERIRQSTAFMRDRKWSMEDLQELAATLDQIVARSTEAGVDLIADVIELRCRRRSSAKDASAQFVQEVKGAQL